MISIIDGRGAEEFFPQYQNEERDMGVMDHLHEDWGSQVKTNKPTNDRKEAMELVIICAKDIVDAWPKMTMRTLGEMTKRIDTLRQALQAASK